MEVLDVWPDNADVWDAWLAMESNWRVIVGQAVVIRQGLEHASLDAVYEGLGIRKRHRQRVFRGLKEMERIALAVFAGVELPEDE